MGLNDFKKKTGPRVIRPSWLTIPNGVTKQLVFLNEPKDCPRIVEHTSPDNWKKRAVCTGAECFACEQRAYDWNQRIRIYIPVQMNGRVYVIAQGIGANSVVHDLVHHKRKYGTIRDVVFEVSRKGEGKRAAYSAVATDEAAPLRKAKVDINQLINNVEYTKQKNYYKE